MSPTCAHARGWKALLCAMTIAGGGAFMAGCGDDGSASNGKKEYTIGFVSLVSGDQFFDDTVKGAQKADRESPEIKVITQATSTGNPTDMVPLIENMLTRNVDALVVTATPEVKAVIERAAKQGVPVVSYGNDLPELKTQIKGTVSTDNFTAGRKAGEYLKKRLGGEGSIALLDYARGTYVALDQRVEGLEKALEGTGIKVVSHLDTTCDVSKAVSAAQNVLTAHRDVNAFFGSCAQNILGAERAVKQAGIDSKRIVMVGYDAKDAEIKAILAGKQDATVAQFPTRMGYLAVQQALKVLKGQKIPDSLDSGSEFITKANAQAFLNNPDR